MSYSNSIIIIGNGPSVLDKENGHLIDEFDVVVRFNEYVIKGFEKHVGTKTTYWFNTVNFLNKNTQFRMHNNYEKIVLHMWEWNVEKDTLYKSFKEFYKDVPIEIVKTNVTTLYEIQKYMNDNSYFAYSTGAIAIWMLLKEFPEVSITGFDWWSSEKHHYSDKAPRGTLHNPQKEYKFITKLMEEGKLKML